MSEESGDAMQRIEVEVPLEVSEYLDEWADAIGAEVAEVGGDAITQYLEEGDDD